MMHLGARYALYPGSFDPITNGHVDIVQRALRLFDKVYIAVGHNAKKKGGLFPPARRMVLVEKALKEVLSPTDLDRIGVVAFQGLVTKAATDCGACAIVRGMRALSDFEFEFQFAHMAKRMANTIEPVFLMTSEKNFYCSSSIVKEVVGAGGSFADIGDLVPGCVADALFAKLQPGNTP